LGIGLTLFWARNNPGDQFRDSIPLTIVTRLAAGGLNRTGLKLLGVVESSTALAGRQLHAAVRMSMRSRVQVLGQCARVATHLIEAGAEGYDLFSIEIDHGEQVSSLVTVMPDRLMELLQSDASIGRLHEAFPETQLLWFNESILRTRLRAWWTLLLTGIKCLHLQLLKNWQEHGFCIGKGRFRIREIENLSSQGVARIRIRAVLKNPSDAKDKQVVREIIRELVNAGRRRLVRSRGHFLDPGIPWPKRPKHIFLDLFRVGGTLRWLRGGGWPAGNVVATAERVWGNSDPVLVVNPEEIYKGIRIRYMMDAARLWEALRGVADVVTDSGNSRCSEADGK